MIKLAPVGAEIKLDRLRTSASDFSEPRTSPRARMKESERNNKGKVVVLRCGESREPLLVEVQGGFHAEGSNNDELLCGEYLGDFFVGSQNR